MSSTRQKIYTRNTERRDFPAILRLCRKVYVNSKPWSTRQLASHLSVFPEGQFVAVERESERVMGMAASLIVRWDDYDAHDSWREFTNSGLFTNHDPVHGRTLYGAEVMVDPEAQGRGIGSKLYKARSNFVIHLGLRRIRAAARLRGFRKHAAHMDAEEYVERVVKGELRDPTLSFQMRHGFQVIDVISGYLEHDDKASLGFAAIIEWLNPQFPHPENLSRRTPRFLPPEESTGLTEM